MSDREIERDRLLTEIHTDMKHITNWTKDHDEKDDERFKDINQKLIYGAIAIIIVAFASGVLGQLINHVSIGG